MTVLICSRLRVWLMYYDEPSLSSPLEEREKNGK